MQQGKNFHSKNTKTDFLIPSYFQTWCLALFPPKICIWDCILFFSYPMEICPLRFSVEIKTNSFLPQFTFIIIFEDYLYSSTRIQFSISSSLLCSWNISKSLQKHFCPAARHDNSQIEISVATPRYHIVPSAEATKCEFMIQ